MQRALRRLCLAGAALAAATIAAAPAGAGKKGQTYYFDVAEVVSKTGEVPATLAEQTRKAIVAQIRKHEQVIDELPPGAPDPEATPKRFNRWLQRRNMRAFRVTVEITAFEQSVENPDTGDQRLKVHTALHMFGETLPSKTFGFTGDGSATVVLEVGSKVRDRDETVARADALELASEKAIAESVDQLRAATKAKKKKRAGKKSQEITPSSAGGVPLADH